VPGEILRKPRPLSPYERGLIVLHTIEGREQLSWLADRAASSGDHAAADFWRLAATIAGGHHERLDGQGYPLGLAGGALPLVLRAARAVDVYEALTARRSYREGLPHEEAIRVMRFEEGGFDERVLTALDAAMVRMRVSAD
jgi:putative two-component system response regulator